MKKAIKSVWTAAVFLVLTGAPCSGTAQDEAEITVGADVVSSYVWRGVYQCGFSIQPTLGVSYKGFSLGAWGSTDLDNFKEVDLAVGYVTGGFELAITDYWWSGRKKPDGSFYPYFKYGDAHYFEGTVAWTFGEKFPLRVSWSTMFAGADKKPDGDDGGERQAYSSYAELSCPFSVAGVDLEVAVGAAPFDAPAWLPTDSSGFQVSNVSLKASKAIPVTKKYSIPVFVQLAANPVADYVNFIAGVSF